MSREGWRETSIAQQDWVPFHSLPAGWVNVDEVKESHIFGCLCGHGLGTEKWSFLLA